MPKKTSNLQDPTPATHGDLNIWGGQLSTQLEETREEVKEVKQLLNRLEQKIPQFATKEDLQKFATKDDLQKAAKQITDHFDKHIDAVVENRASDLLGVKHDEVREIQRKVKNHETRITILEQ